MARRTRSFFFNNKTGELKSKGKTVVNASDATNFPEVKGSTTGNPVAINALGDDTNIDLRLSAKGNGNIEILSTLEILTNKRITDSAGTNVEFGDNIEMNSNKITGVGTPSASTDAATKGYVDSNVSSANDATITITASTGLSGSGSFTTDQSADETITLSIDSTVVTLTGSQTLTNKTLTAPVISSISNTGTLTLPTSTDTLVGRATTDTLTNKTLTSAVLNGSISGTSIKDEDDMSSDSASHLATQQSIKAYVDSVANAAANDATITLTAGTGLSGGGNFTTDQSSAETISFNLDFSELTDMTGDISGTTEFILQDGTTESRKAASEIKISNFNNDSGFTTNTGTVSSLIDLSITATATEINVLDGIPATLTATELGYVDGVTSSIQTQLDAKTSNTGTVTSVGGTGTVNGLTLSGTVTSSGSLTLGGTLSVAVSDLAGSALTTSSETFADNDTTLMTSAAINDRIESFSYISDYTVTEGEVTAHQAALSITESQISDLQSYLTAETNDLTSAVTWANVPDANITQSSVTQHQAALSITESQISDLGSYITASSTDTLTNKTLGATTVSGNIIPDTDSAYDLGSSSVKFRDLYLSGSTLNLDAFSIETHASGITFNHSSNTTLLPVGGGSHTLVTLTETQTLTNKTLTSPTINGGTFTGSIASSGNIDADNFNTDGLKIVDNNIQSTRSNDHINLVPNGTGSVQINGSVWPTGLGTDGYVLTTDGAGTLTWAEGGSGGQTAGHTIQNAGSNLTQRAGLNFDGTYLIATDDSGNSQTDVTVSSTLQTIAGLTYPSGVLVGTSDTQTLTNKTVDSASNTLTLDLSEGTLTGTTAEFNTALSDDSFATLTNTATLTNKTLTSPTINTGTLASNTVTTALTLNAQADLRFADSDSSNWVAFKAPATVSSNVTWTLPAEDGSNTQVLTTNGSGTLSWTDGGGGGGGASTLSGLGDTTISSVILNDLLVYDGSGWVNKNKHEIVPNLPFTKSDGTLQYLDFENARDTTDIMGFINDRVTPSYYIPFTKADGTSVTTLLVG